MVGMNVETGAMNRAAVRDYSVYLALACKQRAIRIPA